MSMSVETSHYGNLSPEYAILGLLLAGPLHGYDLHRRLLADLGQVWHVSQSQAYAILKRLEQRGEISVEQVAQSKLPARQLLHLTQSGREHFEAWMHAPDGSSVRAIRMGFLTRLYFARLHAPDTVDVLYQAQRAATTKSLKRLQATLADLPEEQVINRLSLEMRVRQLELVLGWLDDCLKSPWLRRMTSTHSRNGDPR